MVWLYFRRQFNGNQYFGSSGAGNTVTSYINHTETVDRTTLTINKISNTGHIIEPSFRIRGDLADNFKLGARLWVPVTIRNTSSDNYSDAYTVTKNSYHNPLDIASNYTTTVHTHTSNGLVETTVLNIIPRIGIGASVNLVPDCFTVNAGYTAYPFGEAGINRSITKTSRNGENTTSSKTVNGLGATTSDTVTTSPGTVTDSAAHTDTWNQYSSRISGGFALSFGKQFTLDFLAEAPVDNTLNLNLTTLNIMLLFKF